jgi:curli biogenesis system outer membrane secretion channel CsgG
MLGRTLSIALVVAIIAWPSTSLAQTAGPKPTIAVYVGSASNRSAVAAALTDALIQHLIDTGKYTVIDRQHMQQLVGEQGLSASGQVLPTTEAQLGRRLGANYVLTGQIVTFSSTTEDRTNIGTTFLLGQNAKQYDIRLDLTSNMEVLDVSSGAVLQSLQDHQTDTSPIYGSTTGNRVDAEGYASQEYQKMVDTAAVAYVGKIDSSKFVSSGPATVKTGHIMDVTGGQIVISLGRSAGVTVGTILGAYDVKHLTNPDTGKVVDTFIKRGSLEIQQVEQDYSVAKKVGSGTITKLMVVRVDQ